MTDRELALSITRMSQHPTAAAAIARLEAMTDEEYDRMQERLGDAPRGGPRAPITITQSRRH